METKNKNGIVDFQLFSVKNLQPEFEVTPLKIDQELPEDVGSYKGWSIVNDDPGVIVQGYSHLRIMTGYKLRAYLYYGGSGTNGLVWAIPEELCLPPPSDCIESNEAYIITDIPHPAFALDDFMEAIEGDYTPLSYLQAVLTGIELNEYGAYWHGCSGVKLLPLNTNGSLTQNISKIQWEWLRPIPETWHPCFYKTSEGHPVVELYFYRFAGPQQIIKDRYCFPNGNYTYLVDSEIIASGPMGIIF